MHNWLTANSLKADPSKTELMTFTKDHLNCNLIRGKIEEAWYNNPA